MLSNSAVLGQHFAFAHGRAGVLQQYLLTQSDLDRLLGAHDRSEMHSILLDLPFTKILDQSQRDPTIVIDAFAAWIRAEVSSMVPAHKRAPFDILWMEGDAPLVAALLKERFGLTSAVSRRPTPSVTAYPAEAWIQLVMENTPTALPAEETTFVRMMIKDAPADPAVIDTRVSIFMAQRARILAEKSSSALLVQFVQHSIDIQNIRTALRLVGEGEEETELLPSGTIAPHDFEGNEQSLIALVRRFGFYTLADTLEQPGHTGSDIEQALSAIRADDIRNLWNRPLTIEPVFAFAATALSQLSLLRAILIGKQSDLSPQEIKRLLPPFLSALHYHA